MAAAQGLEQLQRGGASSDGAGLTALTEEVNLAYAVQRLDILLLQLTQLGYPADQEIAVLRHHIVTAKSRCGGSSFDNKSQMQLVSCRGLCKLVATGDKNGRGQLMSDLTMLCLHALPPSDKAN